MTDKFNVNIDKDGMSWCSANLLDQGAQDKIKQLEARNNNQQEQIVRLKAQIDILMRVIKER